MTWILIISLICAWTNGEQTIGKPVIWDAISLIMTTLVIGGFPSESACNAEQSDTYRLVSYKYKNHRRQSWQSIPTQDQKQLYDDMEYFLWNIDTLTLYEFIYSSICK